MVYTTSLDKLVSDEYNRLRFVIEKKGCRYNVLSEKLLSLKMWYSIFYEYYMKYDLEKIKTMEINKQTIELINFLSVANGIYDVSLGLMHFSEEVFRNIASASQKSRKESYFRKTRTQNIKHDEYFQILKKDDDEYFKHIRAIFGQHPSNLNYGSSKKPIRAFGSWTYNNSGVLFSNGESDLYTKIYFDLERNGLGYSFHINYNEIKNFVDSKITMISNLVTDINEEVDKFIEGNCKGSIEGFFDLSIREKVEILINDFEHRYAYSESHSYKDALEDLRAMLEYSSVDGHASEEDQYLTEIEDSVDELYHIITNCKNDELNHYEKLNRNILDTIGHNYKREKCAMYINGDDKNHDIFSKVCDKLSEKLRAGKSYEVGDFYYRLYLLNTKNQKVY